MPCSGNIRIIRNNFLSLAVPGEVLRRTCVLCDRDYSTIRYYSLLAIWVFHTPYLEQFGGVSEYFFLCCTLWLGFLICSWMPCGRGLFECSGVLKTVFLPEFWRMSSFFTAEAGNHEQWLIWFVGAIDVETRKRRFPRGKHQAYSQPRWIYLHSLFITHRIFEG